MVCRPQSSLIENLLVNTAMSASKPTTTSMDPGHGRIPNDNQLTEEEAYRYRSIVGALL